MYIRLKKNRAVSPIVATILIIALTLAATSIIFLVVMPMLNPASKPNLVLNNVTFKDYDNDGNADYMELQLQNLNGGADANITQLLAVGTLEDKTYEAQWKTFPDSSVMITQGSEKTVAFIPIQDDTDELPNNLEVTLTVITTDNNAVALDGGTISATPGSPVSVSFTDNTGKAIEGAQVDFYFKTGEFAYSGGQTDTQGKLTKYLFPGEYYARATYSLSFYYSEVFVHPGESTITLSATGGGSLIVKVQSGSTPLANVPLYLYDTNGHYLGQSATTGSDGTSSFSVTDGSYIVRADYLGYSYYSNVINYPSTTTAIIDVGGGTVFCKVIDGGDNPISNVRVYLFKATGQYTGKYSRTNSTGFARFDNIGGGQLYKFRVDYLALHLWSQEFAVANNSVVPVNVGGGTIYVNVTDASGTPIKNTRTYLFTSSGRYTGKYAYTNGSGIATYERVSAGIFKIRIDYLAQYFWSPEFNATNGLIVQASIGGGTLYGNITAGGHPIKNTRVYLFTSTGRYTGKYGYTDTNGIVTIQGVGTGTYKLRVDYQAGYHWSDPFYFNETMVVDVDIGGGTVYANVTDAAGTPITNVRVYLFTENGRYTGSYNYTNSSGIATFSVVSAGNYKFRVDYLAQYFWSDVFQAANGLIVHVNIGGGMLTVHLFNNYNYDIANTRVYLFTENGRYTGKYAYTNDTGYAVFTGIGSSRYKLRADYLAMYYWSSVFDFSQSMVFEFNIGGGIVYMHVFDGNGTDIAGPRAYLFTSSGRYTGYYAYLNGTGYVSCPRIGDGTFKWRVDYLAKYYWSPEFTATNGSVLDFNIGGGTIYAHVLLNGSPYTNQRIYLFTDTGRYTGKYAYTNDTGYAEFTGIGSGNFKFRAYYSGSYYWSNVFAAQNNLVVTININTSGLLLLITSDSTNTQQPPIKRFKSFFA